MTNQLTVVLVLAIAGLIGADLMTNDGDTLVFLGKKLFWLIDWLAFWR